ncbi:Olfactory receptor 56A5 [Sciurus carolinensis]|nr:Olfactory receptor 56A5 [Sciurus carolinensis]
MVLSPNNTGTQVMEFLMICFPGMQDSQHWLSVVLAPLLALALGANVVLLITIWQEASLHEPMYYLLAILSVLDVILCLTVIPKV